MSGHRNLLNRHRGVSLVSALFLLVVLAALGVYAVRINVLQQQTATSALRGTQALHAAKSGAAWAAYRAMNGGLCAAATFTLTEGGAAGFDVDVQCTRSVHAEGGSTVNIYVLDVLAEAGQYGGPDYVSRRLQVKIADAT